MAEECTRGNPKNQAEGHAQRQVPPDGLRGNIYQAIGSFEKFLGEMEMKMIRVAIFCLGALLFAAPMLRAQDLANYRNFSLGTNLAAVMKHTDQKPADVKVICERPALVQELTWWPPNLPGAAFRSDTVEQILFSFDNGELYKISVIYDRGSTEGLTAADMMKAISAKYGPPTNVAPESDAATTGQYNAKGKPVAMWEDSQHSFNLVRSSFTDGFELVIYSKRVNAEAEVSIADAVKLAEQEGPKREAERQKKETSDLEVTRQKNQKSFRP